MLIMIKMHIMNKKNLGSKFNISLNSAHPSNNRAGYEGLVDVSTRKTFEAVSCILRGMTYAEIVKAVKVSRSFVYLCKKRLALSSFLDAKGGICVLFPMTHAFGGISFAVVTASKLYLTEEIAINEGEFGVWLSNPLWRGIGISGSCNKGLIHIDGSMGAGSLKLTRQESPSFTKLSV